MWWTNRRQQRGRNKKILRVAPKERLWWHSHLKSLSVLNKYHVNLPSTPCFYSVQVGFLPVKQSRSSASSGTGFFFSSCMHSFFIFLDRTGRRPWRDEASTPSPGASFWKTQFSSGYSLIIYYREARDNNWLNMMKKHYRKTNHSIELTIKTQCALWDLYLQISAFPRRGALQRPVNPVDGCFLWVGIHAVQAGAASLFHQSGNARTIQSLLKLLDKLEESPEREEDQGQRVLEQKTKS